MTYPFQWRVAFGNLRGYAQRASHYPVRLTCPGLTHELALEYILGITKAYTTRVGSGPFPTELEDEIGRQIAVRENEVDTTTERPRRCGWFDAAALKRSIQINGVCLGSASPSWTCSTTGAERDDTIVRRHPFEV